VTELRRELVPARGSVRLAEVIAALSLATDLAMGQPMAFALRSCVASVRLGEALGYGDAQLSEIYYQALLRYIGCNAETHVFAALFGDELALRRDFATIDPGNLPAVLTVIARHVRAANGGAGPLHMATGFARGMASASGVTRDAFAGHCEVAQRLAERLGFSDAVVGALGQLYERWDGHGQPNGLKGEAIAPAVRVVSLVQDALAVHDANGADAAVAMVRQRRGAAYDPAIADAFRAHTAALLPAFANEPSWDDVLALEPAPRAVLSDAELHRACVAMADFADLKSPHSLGHSRDVAELAARAAERCGLGEDDVSAIERAGLLHDIGSVAVSSGIWCKTGALSESDTERVRMHVYFTERILAKSPTLARFGAIAAQHHERSDGSGYHRAVRANALSPGGKILAAADAYHAMVSQRPHRTAFAPDDAAVALKRDARDGRFDPEAVNAVLAAAGHRVAPVARAMVAGLTERELAVLRLLARGEPTKQIAAALKIAPKTADNHIQSVYAKIHVGTRAGATLFAVEHGLLADAPA
jgi:HD-GYP domain-containing protein (c-di-GMP phosphodiesterase class II)